MHMDCQSPHASGSSRNSAGRERVSFGTNMSSEEESEDNSTSQMAGLQTGSEVIKVGSRRGGVKVNKGSEKKMALGIKGTTNLKKQRTLVKSGRC
jgi:hypothetical protein